MEKFHFKNIRSQILNWFVKRKLSADDYNKLINQCINNFDDIFDNGLPNNYFYSPCAFQFQEMYSRGDNQAIKKLFTKLLHYSDKSNYRNNKNDIDKCIMDLQEGKYRFSSRSFYNLIIKNKHIANYISEIKISVESVGDSFFKITFNCYFSDIYKYKLWLAATTNILPEIEYKFNLRNGITYHIKSGLQIKKESLLKLEKEAYINIKLFFKSIVAGIFWGIFKEFPCTLVSSLSRFSNIYIYGGYKFYDEKPDTSFFDAIIDSDSNHGERYISEKSFGIYVPVSGDTNNFCKMYMKHFHDGSICIPTTDNLSWYSILYFLLYYQLKLLTNTKNQYFNYDIKGMKVNFIKAKKRINAIDSIILIVKSQYDYDMKQQNFTLTKYVYDIYEKKIDYIEEYKNKINYLFKRINSEMSIVNRIYEDRYAMNNDKKNITLQWAAIILTCVTILQPIIQCKIDTYNNITENEKLSDSFNLEQSVEDSFVYCEFLEKRIE